MSKQARIISNQKQTALNLEIDLLQIVLHRHRNSHKRTLYYQRTAYLLRKIRERPCTINLNAAIDRAASVLFWELSKAFYLPVVTTMLVCLARIRVLLLDEDIIDTDFAPIYSLESNLGQLGLTLKARRDRRTRKSNKDEDNRKHEDRIGENVATEGQSIDATDALKIEVDDEDAGQAVISANSMRSERIVFKSVTSEPTRDTNLNALVRLKNKRKKEKKGERKKKAKRDFFDELFG